MRHLAPLFLALLLCLSATSVVQAKPARDDLRFNPHAIQSPTELIDTICRFESRITQGDHTPARDGMTGIDLTTVQMNLLRDWLGGLDSEVFAAERRETQSEYQITYTEQVFLSWCVATEWLEDWGNVQELALKDLRLNRPQRVLDRYQKYLDEGLSGEADRDRVFLYLHQIGGARIRAGGELWRRECLMRYRETAADLLSEHPEFAGMNRYAGRPPSLQARYEDPEVEAQVHRLRTILDLLIASGPEGYQAILDYRADEGAEAFLPYPEKIALEGGGLGLPLLHAVLAEPGLSAEQREGLLEIALLYAPPSNMSDPWFAIELMNDQASLYPYQHEQRAWIEQQFRNFIANVAQPTTDPPAVFYPDFFGAYVPVLLSQRARMVSNFERPLEEVDRLLASHNAQAQAVGLAAIANELQFAIDWEFAEHDGPQGTSYYSEEEWLSTEANYLPRIAPFFTSSDALLRDLALMVLLQFTHSPAPLKGERATLTTSVVGTLITLQALGDLRYHDLPRTMALSMHRRGIAPERIRGLAVSVEAYADEIDPEGCDLDELLEILSFMRGLTDPPAELREQLGFFAQDWEESELQPQLAARLDALLQPPSPANAPLRWRDHQSSAGSPGGV